MNLYLLLGPPLTLSMRAFKLISELNCSGEDGADRGEERDKIDSTESREAARGEKAEDEEFTKEEPEEDTSRLLRL